MKKKRGPAKGSFPKERPRNEKGDPMNDEEYAAYWKRRREKENMKKTDARQKNGARSYVKRLEVMIESQWCEVL